jgi:hypothetical protein
MSNSTMLFKHPGPHKADEGSYDYIIVDADETGALDAAVEAGWSLTVREAFAKATPVQPEADEPAADAAPARARKAKE